MCETSKSFEFWNEFWNLSGFVWNSYRTFREIASIDDNRFERVKDFYETCSKV